MSKVFVHMLSVLLKHKIYELAIETLFDRAIDNFKKDTKESKIQRLLSDIHHFRTQSIHTKQRVLRVEYTLEPQQDLVCYHSEEIEKLKTARGWH